jgi:hypothetical protein
LRINNVRTQHGKAIQIQINANPDSCPICHRAINPVDLSVSYITGTATPGQNVKVERVLQCPDARCQHIFISRYEGYVVSNNQVISCSLRRSVPVELEDTECSEIIRGVSPDYCEIYNQAHKAEQANLDLVAGPGYRKALEFLIKDYLLKIHEKPEEQAEIQKMLLGRCISKYVTHNKIKLVAARAAWLGNDETHFIKKWEGKDLNDLKTLIQLTVRWIEMEKMTADVEQDMPTGKA